MCFVPDILHLAGKVKRVLLAALKTGHGCFSSWFLKQNGDGRQKLVKIFLTCSKGFL